MNGILIGICVLFLFWLPIRCHRFLTISKADRRIFMLFWIWPIVYFVHQYFLKIWLCNLRLYQIVFFLICTAIVLDGFYYFLLKTQNPNRLRHQIYSGILFLPVLVFAWALHRQPAQAIPLVLPNYDKAWVWSSPWWNPKEFHFMKPEASPPKTEKAYQDPNYAQAIFAPCSGTLEGFDPTSGLLTITPEGFESTTISLGPFLPETIRGQPRQTIVAGQPLGLQAGSGSIPGIHLSVSGKNSVVFTQFLSGQLWARPNKQGLPRRNQTVTSTAASRFQLRPEP